MSHPVFEQRAFGRARWPWSASGHSIGRWGLQVAVKTGDFLPQAGLSAHVAAAEVPTVRLPLLSSRKSYFSAGIRHFPSDGSAPYQMQAFLAQPGPLQFCGNSMTFQQIYRKPGETG